MKQTNSTTMMKSGIDIITTNTNDPSYLEHYGIKGMKWGVRRTPEQLGHKTSSKRQKRRPSEDYKTSRNIRKKRVYEMSNQELRAVNDRMQLELRYVDLKKQRSAVTKGKNSTTKTLKTIGKISSAALAVAAIYKIPDSIISQYNLTPQAAAELRNAFKSAKVVADLLSPKKK